MGDQKKSAAMALQRLKKYEFETFCVKADAATRDVVSLAIANLLDAKPSSEDPEVTIEISKKGAMTIETSPLILAGTFRILSQGMPAGKQECEACRGSGCAKCSYAGTKSGESAEEIISRAFVHATEGKSARFVHKKQANGAYSFLVTITGPKKRRTGLQAAADGINKGGKVLLESLKAAQ